MLFLWWISLRNYHVIIIAKHGSEEVQWMSWEILWLVFITHVTTEEKLFLLIMKSDSIYSPPCLSFCAHSPQCGTFSPALIIPAVIYVHDVHICSDQIIDINLIKSRGTIAWICNRFEFSLIKTRKIWYELHWHKNLQEFN